MVISCILPIPIIRNPSFTLYISELDPSFNMPNIYTMTKRNGLIDLLILNLINNNLLEIRTCKINIKIKIIQVLMEVDAVNISLDLWSDATMRGFVGIIAHRINRDWQMIEQYDIDSTHRSNTSYKRELTCLNLTTFSLFGHYLDIFFD